MRIMVLKMPRLFGSLIKKVLRMSWNVLQNQGNIKKAFQRLFYVALISAATQSQLYFFMLIFQIT